MAGAAFFRFMEAVFWTLGQARRRPRHAALDTQTFEKCAKFVLRIVKKKLREASKNFVNLEKTLKDNPNDIKAHIDLSNAFFGIGKISECYQLLIDAIKIDPKWNDQEARKKLISFINSHDLNSEEAKKARRQLSSILFN